MIVARIIPRVMDLPQCEAIRQTIYANDTPETDKQCTKRGRFMIADHAYCLRHAEVLALNMLLESTDLKMLDDLREKSGR